LTDINCDKTKMFLCISTGNLFYLSVKDLQTVGIDQPDLFIKGIDWLQTQIYKMDESTVSDSDDESVVSGISLASLRLCFFLQL
jgi:6-phosphogluconolactonase/glucosamine-6-phosphate isomerase/deaminase